MFILISLKFFSAAKVQVFLIAVTNFEIFTTIILDWVYDVFFSLSLINFISLQITKKYKRQ